MERGVWGPAVTGRLEMDNRVLGRGRQLTVSGLMKMVRHSEGSKRLEGKLRDGNLVKKDKILGRTRNT